MNNIWSRVIAVTVTDLRKISKWPFLFADPDVSSWSDAGFGSDLPRELLYQSCLMLWGGYSLYIKSPKRLRPAQPGEQRTNVGASRSPLTTSKFKSLNWSFSTDVVPYKASGVLYHLVSSFLHCRQQSVQYKKFSWCLHQLFINLHRGPQDVKCEDDNTKRKEITTQCLSY